MRTAGAMFVALTAVILAVAESAGGSTQDEQATAGKLTRFGAPAPVWRASHAGDRRFFGAARTGRVLFYEADLIPAIGRATALSLVRREAPSDSIIVYDIRKPTCEMVQYRSAILKQETGTRTMNAELSATAAGGRYRSRVGNIIFATLPLGDRTEAC